MPTVAPTIAPTSHVRVESINPEPVVLWNETMFADVSSEELLLEVASLHSAEQKSHGDGASVFTQRSLSTSWAPTDSPTSSMSLIMPPVPPREIVFHKSKTGECCKSDSGGVGVSLTSLKPLSPRSPRRAPPSSEAKPSGQQRMSSPTSYATKGNNIASLPCSQSLPVRLASVDVAVPLNRELSLPNLCQTQQASEERRKSFVSFLLDHLVTLESNLAVSETGINQSSPLSRFMAARVKTFLNNVEFLTGIPVSEKRLSLKEAEEKVDIKRGEQGYASEDAPSD